ncbi:hypothetical protein C8F04DRAFT_1256750 [Mycena alexandri]|uniref:Uncharacterized protein n=1 Tax=Mycena alexandri TaxID=1745969 RepID=A0AAD6XA78_9AGAR|nr:hypothetical protein C8F04DRAFT_1256750 [Mycena alexandri]
MSSNQQPQQQDPNQWVSSPKGAFYWRHATGSYWKGPADDRVWVPSMDSPPNLPPPPDFGAPQGDAAGAPPATQFGSSTPIPAGGLNVQMPPVYRPRDTPSALPPTPPRAPPPTQQTGFVSVHSRPAYPDHSTYNARDGPRTAFRRWGEQPTQYNGRRDEPVPENTSRRPWEDARGTTPRSDHNFRVDARREPSRAFDPAARRESHRAQTHEFQERARDQQLRDRALSSRPPAAALTTEGVGAPARPPPPRVEDAERDVNGHPRLPAQAAADDDESDYGGSSDDDEKPDVLKKFNARETFRHAEANQKKKSGLLNNPGKPVQRPSALVLGVWDGLRYNTVPEARNLIRWMLAGCPRARAMFVYLRDYYEQRVTELRSVGIQYLLRQQNLAERTWVYNTTGDSTPLSRRNNAPPASRLRNERRRFNKKKNKTGAMSFTDTGSSRTAETDLDDPMPESDSKQDDPFEQSYLGLSPPPASDDPSNPAHASASLTVALEYNSRRSPRTWMGGARLISGEWPLATMSAGLRMLPNDARASRFVGFIAPTRGDTSIDRTRFINEWTAASLPLEHYPFECSNVTLSQALSWVHQHGILPNSPDALALHQFAASWRNQFEGNARPDGQEFMGEAPRSVIDVLSWPDARITEWRQLQHGPVRRGVSTTYPRHPASAEFGTTNVVPPSQAIAPEVEMPAADPEDGEITNHNAPNDAGASNVTGGKLLPAVPGNRPQIAGISNISVLSWGCFRAPEITGKSIIFLRSAVPRDQPAIIRRPRYLLGICGACRPENMRHRRS